MTIPTDGKHVVDATQSELGDQIKDLSMETIKRFHKIIMDSKDLDGKSHSLMGFMFNSSLVFMQFIEHLIVAFKASMASAYSHTADKYCDGNHE